VAFTPTQEDQIRQYLGFAAGFYDLNTRFESMLDTIGADAVAQSGVEAIMAKIVLVEAAVASGGTSSEARGSLKEIVGDVGWYSIQESQGAVTTARDYGRILINRLAARFGFTRDDLPSDYFGEGGWRGGEMALG
jgi:hypothetical protein